MKKQVLCLVLCVLLYRSVVSGAIGDSSTRTVGVKDFVPPHKLYVPVARKIFYDKPLFLRQDKSNTGAPVIYPTDFGADPFGKMDSTIAFQKAIKVLLSRGANHSLADGVKDLGGAELNLAGGDYLISAPIIIPQYYGNLLIHSGTIRASKRFPAGSAIIEVGSRNCSNGQDACNENIGFQNLMLDAQQNAAGGMLISATMGTSVGPQVFILGFDSYGISIVGGHETMIHQTWLGEYLYSDPRSQSARFLHATAIQIFGNDHFVDDTIVFSSLVGVAVTGAANLLTGVHTWNLASSLGGVGILIDAPGYTQNRLIGCYLDFNDIVAVAPEHLTITDGFFLCGGNIVLKAVKGHTAIKGLDVVNNQFDQCGNETILLDQSQARFTSIQDIVVENNMYSSGYAVKSSRASASLYKSNATRWEFDFSSRLLFSEIRKVEYSVALDQGFARHAARAPQGLTVAVETDLPVPGTVFISVDQSEPSHPCC